MEGCTLAYNADKPICYYSCRADFFILQHRRKRREKGAGERGDVPPKLREKHFSGNYYVKFGHFFGQKPCEILKFC